MRRPAHWRTSTASRPRRRAPVSKAARHVNANDKMQKWGCGQNHIGVDSYSAMNKRLAALGLYDKELIQRMWGDIQRG
jgi:hypothetical protein